MILDDYIKIKLKLFIKNLFVKVCNFFLLMVGNEAQALKYLRMSNQRMLALQSSLRIIDLKINND